MLVTEKIKIYLGMYDAGALFKTAVIFGLYSAYFVRNLVEKGPSVPGFDCSRAWMVNISSFTRNNNSCNSTF